MAFVQIIELTTSRPDEVEALVSGWRAQTTGRRTGQRGTFTKDRDRPETAVQVVGPSMTPRPIPHYRRRPRPPSGSTSSATVR